MKKVFLILLSVVLSGAVASAQDLITKKNGEDIKAKILEVNQNEVKYRKWDNLDGPIFTIAKYEILIVRYENGTNEVFNSAAPVYGYSDDTPPAQGVQPGMRYKDYHKLYRASDYVYQPGDQYSPVVGGVCSWLIPGLGQMICGELGRGFGWFGGAVGCGVVTGVGAGLIASSYSYDYYTGELYYNTGMAAAGSILVIAGCIALIGVDIAAIVDGVKVAKIKNMYNQDMRKLSSVSVELQPYFATTSSTPMTGTHPVAGASLRIRF